MGLLEPLFNKLFPPLTLYVRLCRNKLEVRCIETKANIIKSSSIDFSNDRLLIADFLIAEEFLMELIDDVLDQKGNFLQKKIQIVLQPIDRNIATFCSVERKTCRDFAEFSGASKLWLCLDQSLLTDDQVVKLMDDDTELLSEHLRR
tara:strand:- start:491 stop:931 length:441 start_codon:yes stop_codon:yes gene_type:complete